MGGLLDLTPTALPHDLTPGVLPHDVPTSAPVDPQAGVAAMLATPDQRLHSYVKSHAALSALRLLGATLSDVSRGMNGESPTNATAALAELQGHADQPLQLAQAKARMAGLMQAYATASPQMKALILSDPETAMKTLAKNQEMVKLGQGDSLGNAGGIAATAPVMGVDQASGTAFSQTPAGVTPQGQFGGGFTAGAGGMFSTRSGPGSYQGVTQPQQVAPGATPGVFTPSLTGAPSPPAAGIATAPAAAPAPQAAAHSLSAPMASLVAGITAAFPGTHMTSGYRSVSANAAVGGVPNSLHTAGEAADFHIPAGMTGTQFAEQIRAKFPGASVLYEGPGAANSTAPHVHVQLHPGGAPVAVPGSAPPPAPPGWQIGPREPAVRIVHGSQIPGGDPNQDYKVTPTDISVLPKSFSMDTVQANRHAFYSSKQFNDAAENLSPISGLFSTINALAPGGTMSIAALDTLNKSLNPGGIVRPTSVNLFLDHLGLPEEIKSHILNATGNGILSPTILKQISQTAWIYARSHVKQAADLADKDTALAVSHGFKPEDVGESAPVLPPVPKFAQDTIPPAKLRTVGKVYWGPNGPGRWTTKGWVGQ